MSSKHDNSHLFNLSLAGLQDDRRSWSEPADWGSREFRRKLRTWTPQSHVDVAVDRADLPALGEQSSGQWLWSMESTVVMDYLRAPRVHELPSHAMAEVAVHLAKAELRLAAQSLRQKRLSRNALPVNASPGGAQPTAPPGRFAAATRRLSRGTNLRPAFHRLPSARRNLRFAKG